MGSLHFIFLFSTAGLLVLLLVYVLHNFIIFLLSFWKYYGYLGCEKDKETTNRF